MHGAPAAPLRVLYGGTFDPVHEGHLAVARSARDRFGATVHLMPAADPPHRAAPGASATHRARMLELAVAGERGLVVDRRELAREGRSYTVDTLRALRAEIGDAAPVALLVGGDSFLGLPQWKHWRELFDLAHFIVAERPGSTLDSAMPAALAARADGRWTDAPDAFSRAPAGLIHRLRQPLNSASASGVRARIAAGEPWRELVPPPVAAYIDRHRLYAAGGGASS